MLKLSISLFAALSLFGCGHSETPAPHLERYSSPIQSALPRTATSIETSTEEKLRPRAGYELEAYVMKVKTYRMDKLSNISPMDMAVAWGPAAAEGVQSLLSVELESRNFTWELKESTSPLYLTRGVLASNIANIHVIPANDEVLRKLKRVKAGDSLRAQGMLVDIFNETVGERRTSLSRMDTGAGSAEIFYISSLEVLERP